MAAVLVVLLSATSVALAVRANRNGGAVTAVSTVTENEFASTSGTTFTTVPGMQTTVNVPAGEDALLVITFSAVSLCTPDETDDNRWCYIRVLVDGVQAASGTVEFHPASRAQSTYGPPGWGANSMQFVHRVNASGPHTVTVQWATGAAFWWFAMDQRTLTVLRSRIG